jgi:hypothetical protein
MAQGEGVIQAGGLRVFGLNFGEGRFFVGEFSVTLEV